jgi:hypothetical protein
MCAAVIAARGPAIEDQVEYSWPSTVPTASPSRTWFTPLLLARHRPQSLDARIPCGDERTLSGAGSSTVLFATSRDPARMNGLEVVRDVRRGSIAIHVGRAELARIQARAPERDCSLRIRYRQGAWAIARNDRPVRLASVDAAPNVVGLITQLDLRARPDLSVTVRPIPQDTSPSVRQTTFRILAAILLIAAIACVLPSRPRIRSTGATTWKLGARDAVVFSAVGAWWLLSPLQHDDGWVRARQTNSLASGGFSNYFEHWGANLPLATWLEWLQHLEVAHTTELALHRLPAVVALLATWLVCRSCLSRRLGANGERNRLAWWSATLVFASGAVAFGITLRPEPVVALLAVTVLACCLRYVEKPAVEPLVPAILLCGLAVTVHPSGVVAAAPLLVCLGRIVRDVRGRAGISPASLASLFPIGAAWALLLAYLDSDTTHRGADSDLIRAGGGHGAGVFQEFERYARLSDGGASPLRRMVVAVLLLTAAAFLTSRFRRRALADLLPAASVTLGLVFLALTPSKWIWHFGGLIGICAVAIGVETQRLAATDMSRLRKAAIATAVASAAVWASFEAIEWGVMDTVWVHWSHVPAPYVAAVLVAAAGVYGAGRLQRLHRPELALLPAVVGSLVAVTVLLFSVDALAGHGWTPSRQAVSSLFGRDACGVASDVEVDVPEGRPPVSSILEGSRWSQWYELHGRSVGVFVGGSWASDDGLLVSWGRRTSGGVDAVRPGFADLGQASPGPNPAQWRFVSEAGFPRRPLRADVVRLRVVSARGNANVAVTRPVPYSRVSLSSLLGRRGTRSLVSPYLFEATPCARPMVLAHGTARPPRYLVDSVPIPSLTNFTSPILWVSSVLTLERLPLETSGIRGPIFVYRVSSDRRDGIAPARTRSLRE